MGVCIINPFKKMDIYSSTLIPCLTDKRAAVALVTSCVCLKQTEE